MQSRLLRVAVVGLLAFTLNADLMAITTVEVEVTCPVCKTKNKFYDYASWGSYIYGYKTRFQNVYFPYTWSTTLYTCKHCHLSLFMWDFRELKPEQAAALELELKNVKVQGDFNDYLKIPMSEKMAIAERMYRILGREDRFWEHFYRLEAYHLANENRMVEAGQARARALEIVAVMLGKPENEGHRRELLMNSGILRHFLGDDAKALGDLRAAKQLTFTDKELRPEQQRNYNEFLANLIDELITGIEKGTIPTDYRNAA